MIAICIWEGTHMNILMIEWDFSTCWVGVSDIETQSWKMNHLFLIMNNCNAIKYMFTFFYLLLGVVIWVNIIICAITIKRRLFPICLPSFFLYVQVQFQFKLSDFYGMHMGQYTMFLSFWILSISVLKIRSILVCSFLVEQILHPSEQLLL